MHGELKRNEISETLRAAISTSGGNESRVSTYPLPLYAEVKIPNLLSASGCLRKWRAEWGEGFLSEPEMAPAVPSGKCPYHQSRQKQPMQASEGRK